MNAPTKMSSDAEKNSNSRRSFLQSSASTVAVGATLAPALSVARAAQVAGTDRVRVGLVGCGGRGSSAAVQAMRADPRAHLVAIADVFEDRLQSGLQLISANDETRRQVAVPEAAQFTGFDAYQQLIEAGVDVVLLATPPHFRPLHLRACIEAGRHVFAEKPIAVDPSGVRSVLETAELARRKNLCIVSGLNYRYSLQMQEAVRRVREGAIGDIHTLHTVRYGGGVWVRPRKPGMTDMEYQMRNWYYFTWLSGDFNVEQFVHQLDQVAWLMGDEYPVRCYSTGGRQARTGEEYGHIYDHFSSVFEYASGARLFSSTRHQRGCSNFVETTGVGTKGSVRFARRKLVIDGQNPWQSPDERETDSHQLEHDAFFAALRDGRTINNGHYMANSTMMAIIARMSAYTGQALTWDQAMNSQLDLSPSSYSWDGTPPAATVAVPGVTKFV